jgi:hypothetical protein
MDLNYKIGSDMRIVFAKNALLLISIFGGGGGLFIIP